MTDWSHEDLANTIKVSVLGEVRDINNKLAQVNGQLSKTGKVAGIAGKLVGAAFAGGAVIAGVKSIVSAASDAQQSLGATQTVYGKYADKVVADSKRAAQANGLSANEYRESANLIGSVLGNQGVAMDQLAAKSKKFIGIGGDLAATFGGTTKDAVGALTAAMKGEFEQMERYGVSIKASTVSAELLARGQDKLTGKAADLAKQQVISDLIMKQTAKTQGAFAKEGNTLAGQQQRLAAQFTNLKATIGTALLPVLTKAAAFLNDTVLPKFKEWYGVFKDQILPVIKNVGSMIANTLMPPLSTLGNFLANNKTVVATFAGVILTIVAAVKIWTGVQAALNVVMAANPLALVVIAVAALAAALVFAYKKSETFRNIVDGAFKAIKSVVSSVMPSIKSIITNVWNGIQNVIKGATNVIKGIVKTFTSVLKGDWTGAWNGIKQILSGVWTAIKGVVQIGTAVLKTVMSAAWNGIKSLTSAAWNGIKTAVSNAITGVVGFVKGIPGKVTGALGNLGNLLTNAGKQIIQGLLDGIQAMWGAVQSKLTELTNLIPDWKGPADKDKVLLKNAGKLIMQGLVDGFTEGSAGVQSKLADVTKMIETYYDKKFKKDKKAAEASKEAVKSLRDEAAALATNANKRKTNTDNLKAAVDSYNALVIAKRKEMGLDKTVNDLLDENAAKLDAAKSALQALKDEAKSYADTIRNNMVAFGSITGLIEDGVPESSANIVKSLQDKVDKAKKFAELIQQLAARGLNQTNLDQLIQAGTDAGFATAEALMAGGPDAIAQVNSLTAQLDAAGAHLGATMSARFHTAGIDAAQATVNALASQREALWTTGIQAAAGLVDGFESMGDRLERAGDRLAKKMVKAIKKALDIHSPSRVFKKIGTQTTAGLVIGLEDTKGVERASFRLGKAVEGAFSTPELKAVANASGSTGGNTYEIKVTAPATVDKAALGREIVSAITAFEKSGGRRAA